MDSLFFFGWLMYLLQNNLINRAYRTAICKAKRGGFKDTPADDLLAAVLKVGAFKKALINYKFSLSKCVCVSLKVLKGF